MDFYIRTFECKGWGAIDYSINYTDNNAIHIIPPASSDPNPKNTRGTLDVASYDFLPLPSSHVLTWTIGYTQNTLYYPDFQTVPYFHTIDSGDFVSQYNNTTGRGYGATHPWVTYTPQFDNLGFSRGKWTTSNWTTGTQATFEEELCDFFYTITQQQPSNLGTYTIENSMNLYLYRIYLEDSLLYYEIPIFQKGNDPAYQRIYTASLVP